MSCWRIECCSSGIVVTYGLSLELMVGNMKGCMVRGVSGSSWDCYEYSGRLVVVLIKSVQLGVKSNALKIVPPTLLCYFF